MVGRGAVGRPNYNDPSRHEAREDGMGCHPKGPLLGAHNTEPERGYIEALATRYSSEPKPDLKQLGVFYKNAMGALSKALPGRSRCRHALRGECMDLRPWQLWSPDGKAAEGTEEIVTTLESVLKRNPNHTGANHFYIHASKPRKVLIARWQRRTPRQARTLRRPPGSHARAYFLRTGDYHNAALNNEKAAEVDRQYIRIQS